jgi:diacylglycerol kinase
MNSGIFSVRSRIRSFKYAFRGLWSLVRYEHNSRIHLIASIIVIIAGILLKISPMEWCFLTIVTGLVFITELLNSSLENLADSIDRDRNEFIRKAKDYAAAAVLISVIIAVVVGGIIFIPKIF